MKLGYFSSKLTIVSLPPAYVVRREGTVFTGVCLSTGGGGQPADSAGVGGVQVQPAGGGGESGPADRGGLRSS